MDEPVRLTPPEEPPGWREVDEDPLQRDPRASVGWDVMLWVGLAIVAIGGLLTVVLSFVGDLGAGERELSQDQIMFERLVLYFSIAINAVLFAVIPIVWVGQTRQGGWGAVKPYFQLHRPLPNIAGGLVGGVLMAGALIGIFYLLEVLGWDPGENPLEQHLRLVLTVPLAIAIALQAGITEEILFRGLIQRRIGWIAQAPIFGLFHLTQGWIGFVATTLIGLLFGFLVHRKVSMYAVIAAHFSYDMVLLGLFLAT